MTVVATVADLYETSAVFRAGIEKWVADRRCPLEMGDFLEEHDLPSAADCARWCAAQPDRPVFGQLCRFAPAEDRTPGGTFPRSGGADGRWYFFATDNTDCANCVPYDRVCESQPQDETPELAIVALLDAWEVAPTV